MRVGIGYDSHCFTEGNKIAIGGVTIPHIKGLLAHSDGDVLLHALGDALLGALALGDLGQHFPDSDPKYAGVFSATLLDAIMVMVRDLNYHVVNVDGVVICQSPILKPYIVEMRQTIAESLAVEIGCVSVKATTNEGMGFIGRQEGLAAQVVVLLQQDL